MFTMIKRIKENKYEREEEGETSDTRHLNFKKLINIRHLNQIKKI